MEVQNKETLNVQQPEELAGQVNNQAQEMVENIVGEAVNQPTAEEQKENERREALARLLVQSGTEVQPEEFALTVDGVGVFARNDIHAIKGKQKCGKTTVLKVCIAAWLSGRQFRVTSGFDEPSILYLDTEQKASDVKLIITDVMDMTGLSADFVDEHLKVYALRKRDYNMLLDDMKLLIGDIKPDVVIVDGIVEFVASFNDEALAKALIHDLLSISEENRLAMLCVLHTNKADEDHNMRGHLGTMLSQKAGTVIECQKRDTVITVRCSDARHAEMPDWSIMFNEDGHIVDADEQRRQFLEQRKVEQQQKRREEAERKQKERLDMCLEIIRRNGGQVARGVLAESLAQAASIDRTTASKFITAQVRDGLIFEVQKMVSDKPETLIPF